jgi:p25-alpha
VQGLQDKFLAFAAYGSKKSETQLDGRSYVKLFKDAGLLKKPLTTTDLVCFTKQTQNLVALICDRSIPTACKLPVAVLTSDRCCDVFAGPHLRQGA